MSNLKFVAKNLFYNKPVPISTHYLPPKKSNDLHSIATQMYSKPSSQTQMLKAHSSIILPSISSQTHTGARRRGQ